MAIQADKAKGIYASLPLDHSNRQIRLLKFDHYSGTDALRFIMQVHSLENNPQYEALSYTWGASTQNHHVLVNGLFNFHVTDNLYAALKRFRLHSRDKWLWIDALCINQADTAEKGHQVAFMGAIYQSARSVSIWLGDAEPRIWDGIHLLRHKVKERLWYYALLKREDDEPIKTKIERIEHMDLHLLNKVLKRSTPAWSERAWVQQEFALARSVNLCFSDKKYRLSEVVIDDTYTWFRQLGRQLGRPRDLTESLSCVTDKGSLSAVKYFFDRISYVHENFNAMYYGKSEHSRLTALLRMAYTTHAADDRDKIYSLLNCISSKESAMVGSDYDLTCAEVFARTTRACILAQKSFNVLAYLVDLRDERLSGLPSWALDFSGHHLDVNHNGSDVFHHNWDIPYIGEHDQSSRALASFDPRFRVMRVEGYNLGHLVQCHYVRRKFTTDINKAEYADAINDVLAHGSQHLIPDAMELLTDAPKAAVQRWRDSIHPKRYIYNQQDWATIKLSSIKLFEGYCLRVLPPEYNTPMAFFRTDTREIGLAPINVRNNDVIAKIDGCVSPLVLRPVGQRYLFRGFVWMYRFSAMLVHPVTYNDSTMGVTTFDIV